MNTNKLNAAAQYQKVDIESAVENASPHQLISMLFDGFLKRILEAKGAIQRKDAEAKGVAINKAINIISGLQSSLDDVETNELSQQLNDLYDYIPRLLTQANRESSMEKLDQAAKLIIPIKESWDKIPKEYHYVSKDKKQD